MTQTASTPTPERPLGHEPRPGVLSELLRDLVWPRLLRSVSLAVRPERLFVAAVMVVAIAVTLRIPELWSGNDWRAAVDHVFTFDATPRLGGFEGESASDALSAWTAGVFGFPSRCAALWRAFPWNTLLVAPIVLLAWCIGGCAIARIAACDAAQGIIVTWPEGTRFAGSRAGSLLFAVLGPLALGLVIWLGLAAAGWVLFSLPWVNVLGGAFYVLFLAAAALAVIVLAVYALGFPMLIPAVACEGGDGIDAIGRAYPYVFGKPLRYILYVLLLLALALVAVAVAQWLVDAVTGFASDAASAWTTASGRRVLATGGAGGIGPTGLEGSEGVAARLVRFWHAIVEVVLAAFVVSYFFCASTLLYLAMRRVCDGQDMGEVWMPGMIEGTMSMTLQARATAASASVRTGRAADAADEP